jgi:esterase/lipase superfamily enzyme
MSFDLKYPGCAVFYSWPSHNNWYRYQDDASNISRSVDQIRDFLTQIARESGAESVNLIAHSMGNVGLTQALASMTSTGPTFNQVVLAAPDIDAKIFREEIATKITSRAKRVTLYTSQTDLALIASRYFNTSSRIGDSSDGPPLYPGIETIDATAVDSSLLGHSYYGSNVTVLEDIANLLQNRSVTDRSYLSLQTATNPPYWSFESATRTATTEPKSSSR